MASSAPTPRWTLPGRRHELSVHRRGQGLRRHHPGHVRHRHGRRASCTCRTMDVSSARPPRSAARPQTRATPASTPGRTLPSPACSAISGATITSTAYRGCVETAFAAFETCKGGAANEQIYRTFSRASSRRTPCSCSCSARARRWPSPRRSSAAFGMGIAATAVLILSNMAISAHAEGHARPRAHPVLHRCDRGLRHRRRAGDGGLCVSASISRSACICR